eukprot:COSAG01_NODE_2104_length_8418_cov_94.839644_3_plen_73_part_00
MTFCLPHSSPACDNDFLPQNDIYRTTYRTVVTERTCWVLLDREIYKMNPLCPRKWDYEPIVPQGTHFVSSAS